MTTPTIEAVTADPPVIACGGCQHPWHTGRCAYFGCRCERFAPPEAWDEPDPIAAVIPPMRGMALLVSMHETRRLDVAVMLLGMGWEVATAHDYDQAIEALTACRPALVVVDAMGVRTGTTLMQFVTWARTRDVGGIVWLLQPSTRWASSLRKLGPVVRKPITEAHLDIAIRSVALVPVDVGDTYLDARIDTVVSETERVRLTYTEARLLAYLTLHHGTVVSSDKLLTDVWGYVTPADSATLMRAHMSNLRGKLARVGLRDLIVTYRGRGYNCAAAIPVVG